MAEREQQIAIRREREEIERRAEAEFIRRRDEELLVAEEMERQAALRLKGKAHEQKEIQTQQLEALRQQLLRERVRRAIHRGELACASPRRGARAELSHSCSPSTTWE